MMVLGNTKIVDKDIWQVRSQRSQHRIKKAKHKQTKSL